jgi:hypothetical protein
MSEENSTNEKLDQMLAAFKATQKTMEINAEKQSQENKRLMEQLTATNRAGLQNIRNQKDANKLAAQKKLRDATEVGKKEEIMEQWEELWRQQIFAVDREGKEGYEQADAAFEAGVKRMVTDKVLAEEIISMLKVTKTVTKTETENTNKRARGANASAICSLCGSSGHYSATCRVRLPQSSFAAPFSLPYPTNASFPQGQFNAAASYATAAMPLATGATQPFCPPSYGGNFGSFVPRVRDPCTQCGALSHRENSPHCPRNIHAAAAVTGQRYGAQVRKRERETEDEGKKGKHNTPVSVRQNTNAPGAIQIPRVEETEEDVEAHTQIQNEKIYIQRSKTLAVRELKNEKEPGFDVSKRQTMSNNLCVRGCTCFNAFACVRFRSFPSTVSAEQQHHVRERRKEKYMDAEGEGEREGEGEKRLEKELKKEEENEKEEGNEKKERKEMDREKEKEKEREIGEAENSENPKYATAFCFTTTTNESNNEEMFAETEQGSRVAPFKLKEIFRTTKKLFETRECDACTFCKKKGHMFECCPVRPIRIEIEKGLEGLTDAQRDWVYETVHKPAKTTKDEREKFTWKQAQTFLKTEGERLNQNNPWKESKQKRDKLRARLGYWKAIGADECVLAWIAYGVMLRFVTEPDHFSFRNHPSYEEHIEHAKEEHKTHIADGSFRVIPKEQAKVINPLQVEVNAKGKKRMCSDLRWTNAFLPNMDFCMETLGKDIKNIVKKGDKLMTTDLAKAYYSVLMHESSIPYMCWKHKNQIIAPTVLTFGLSLAPFIFTKLLKPVLNFMRGIGVRVSMYIDDFLWSAEPKQAQELKELVECVLPLLGWEFNDKCNLEPSDEVMFLGMYVNAKTYSISAPQQRINDTVALLKDMSWRCKKERDVSVKTLERVTGKLQSMILAVKGVRVWTRGMYRMLAQAHEEGRKWIHMSDTANEETHFWLARLKIKEANGMHIVSPNQELHVCVNVDAGEMGFGGVMNEECVDGDLPLETVGTSSTRRELVALQLAAKAMIADLKGKSVTIKMDSMPAISNLIKGGGPKADLSREVKNWYLFCETNNIVCEYEWVPREQNEAADKASKQSARSYTLTHDAHNTVRQWAVHMKGNEQITVHVPRFDKVDLRLRAMLTCNTPGTLIVVVPVWKGQAWWNTVKENTDYTLDMGTVRETITQRENTWPRTWKMVACILRKRTKGV